jgi:hypothetical protein
LTEISEDTWKPKEWSTESLHHIILKPVVKLKHQTNKSRTFFKRLSMRWEEDGKRNFQKLYGHIVQPTKPPSV